MLATFVQTGGDYVPAQHEAGAVAMATGWAWATGRAGIACVHQGPGLTNALTALVDADRSGLPLVVIAGQAHDQTHHQHVASADVVNALGIQVRVPKTSEAGELTQVIADAESAGTTIVVLPPGSPEPVAPVDEPLRESAVSSTADDAAAAIADAQRVVLIAGRGAVRAGATPVIADLADHLDAALATSAPAHGAFAGHERCLGMIGGFASVGTTTALQGADLVIAFGASLDSWSTAGGRIFGADTRVLTVNRDAGTVARNLIEMTPPRSASGWVERSVQAARAPREFHPSSGLDPRVLLSEIDRRLPSTRLMSFDSGHFLAIASMTMTSTDGPHLQFGQDFQSVGLGLAHAIGAGIAQAGRLSVAVIGDGGAGMSILELTAGVDRGLPLLVLVVNDAGYGAEVHDFKATGLPMSLARFPVRDWGGVAQALGATSATITSLGDLTALDQWLQAPTGPLVLDCRVDPDVDAVSIMTGEGQAEWSHPGG
jgi:thiamine pyrophosphate-dependent acetolactate synthase large subunit-like protein